MRIRDDSLSLSFPPFPPAYSQLTMAEEERHSDSGKHSKSHHGLPSLHLPFHLPGKHHHHHSSTESTQSSHGRISPIMFLPRRHSHQGVAEESHSDNGKGQSVVDIDGVKYSGGSLWGHLGLCEVCLEKGCVHFSV